MDQKLLLVKCICLLYREAEIDQKGTSAVLCVEALETVKTPEASMEAQSGKECLIGLHETVRWMIDNKEDKAFDKTQLLQRVRVNTKDESYLYNAVVDGVEKLDDKDQIQEQIVGYRQEIKQYLSGIKIDKIIVDKFRRLKMSGEKVNYTEFVREVVSELEPYTKSGDNNSISSLVDSVSLENEDDISDMMEKSRKETSGEGIIRTGYQGINRMLGDHGGFRRGEMVVIPALQHNFKSGFALNLFKQAALYNTPYMRDPAKKPMMIHLSLENELTQNITWLYSNLKENEDQAPCDPNTVDLREASKYVKERMGATGYRIEMLRVDPSSFTFFDMFDLIMNFESQGYEVHMIVCDYLSMMSKQGCTQGPAGTEIRDLFRRVRNFMGPRGITFVTPHQFSTEAKMLVRQGVEEFVKEVANKGYYDSCKTIDQEVDLEINIHIERIPGIGAFLTCQRGKHRKVNITPEKDHYTVLPFDDKLLLGGILDDINGADSSRKSVGGRAMGEGGDDWFDL